MQHFRLIDLNNPAQRERALNALWDATHPDFRYRRPDGTKTVIAWRDSGNPCWGRVPTSVPISLLTDEEIRERMPKR